MNPPVSEPAPDRPAPPTFDGTVKVDSLDDSDARLLMIAIATGSLFPMAPVFGLIGILDAMEAAGRSAILVGLGHIGMFLLALIMMLVGFAFPFLIAKLLSPSRAKPFSASCRVEADAAGLNIHGLGLVPWRRVQALEAIPDSEDRILVHVAGERRLMFSLSSGALAGALLPAMLHHMGERPADVLRVQLFDWRWFQFMIAAGHAAAAATFWFVWTDDHRDFGDIRKWVGLLLLPPLVAVLIWMPAGWSLSLFGARKVKSLYLESGRLRSLDGRVDVELRGARVRRRRAKGLAYDFPFVSVAPRKGRTLYLLEPDDAGWPDFLERLEALVLDGR